MKTATIIQYFNFDDFCKNALTKLVRTHFLIFVGLVDCYVAGHRIRGAITCAGEAYRRLGQNARSLTLVASVLAEEPLSLEKVGTPKAFAATVTPLRHPVLSLALVRLRH